MAVMDEYEAIWNTPVAIGGLLLLLVASNIGSFGGQPIGFNFVPWLIAGCVIAVTVFSIYVFKARAADGIDRFSKETIKALGFSLILCGGAGVVLPLTINSLLPVGLTRTCHARVIRAFIKESTRKSPGGPRVEIDIRGESMLLSVDRATYEKVAGTPVVTVFYQRGILGYDNIKKIAASSVDGA